MSPEQNIIDGAQPSHGLDYHAWPKAYDHLWSTWKANTPRRGGTNPKPATEYRTCLHPKCKETEVREVSKA